MPFLFPALLWLLPLAAVPILLHLLTLHRLKTVELSTYRFLFDSYIQQRRRMQFLEALLAVLRTLFLLFVVLMSAHLLLAFTAPAFGGGRHDVVLLVDCSASMNARSGGRSAFDRAKSAALAVARDLGPEDTLTLVEVGARPRERFSLFSRDAKNVQEEIDGLKTTSSRGNVFAALEHVFGPDAPKRTNPVVYLFSDCQASGWREVKTQGLEGLIPDKTPIVVVDVGAADDLSNRAVIGDAPRRGRAVAGLPYLLQPRVVNSSKTETADLTLSVFIEDKEVSRTALTLKPGETAVRRIPYTPSEPGLLRGRFEISSPTPDRFPDDDRYLFALNVSPRVKAVIVDSRQPPGQPPDVDEAHYLNIALTSGVHAPSVEGKPPADDLLPPFDVQVVPEAALTPAAAGQVPEALKDARLVLLANCGGLQEPQFDGLRTFVAEGGGMLIFPGDSVDPQRYDDKFFRVPGPQGERLTAARLEAAQGDLEKADAFEQLGKIDFGHPALTVFDDPEAEQRPLSFRVYKWFKITLPPPNPPPPAGGGKGGGNAWPLAWFSGGSPALVESRLGDGDVILAAFPAHTRWTNLPTRKDFTPLVLQLANHVARRPPVDAPPVVLADGPAEFVVNGLWGDVQAAVKKPLGGDAVPVAFERNGPRLLASFTDTSERGYYTLDVKSRALGQGQAGSAAFAVNLSPEESDFTMLNEAPLRELLPSAKLTFVDASAEGAKVPGTGSQGDATEAPHLLWFILLLAVFANEFFLATWGARRKKAGEEGADRVHQARVGSWIGGMAGAGQRS